MTFSFKPKPKTSFDCWHLLCSQVRLKIDESDPKDFKQAFNEIRELFFDDHFSEIYSLSTPLTDGQKTNLYTAIGELCICLNNKFKDRTDCREEYQQLKYLIIRRCEDLSPLLGLFVKKKLEETSKHNAPPAGFIKTVAIEINQNYFFDNSPFATKEDEGKPNPADKKKKPEKKSWKRRFLPKFLHKKELEEPPIKTEKPFIGREGIRQLFLKFLINCGDPRKGVFLVTGYRGMGKTSFVNQVINDYQAIRKTEGLQVIPISINLAQTQPSEIDILRLMVAHVYDKRSKIDGYIKAETKKKNRDKWPKLIILTGITLVVLLLGFRYLESGHSPVHLPFTPHPAVKSPGWNFILIGENYYNLLYAVMLISLGTIAFGIMRLLLVSYKDDSNLTMHERLELLYKRVYASVRTEQLSQSDFTIEQLGAKLSGGSQREVINYPLASSKEIEYELIEFLSQDKVREKTEFIFILDELDKIESPAISTNYIDDPGLAENNQRAYLQQIRDRKQAIINIIAGLKNFLTIAPARFIFIAGREMFDATLADVADRQSSVGSIFNYVFYVESFLKESIGNDLNSKVSLSGLIEKYLKMMLIGKAGFDDDRESLYEQVYQKCFHQKIHNAKLEIGQLGKIKPVFIEVLGMEVEDIKNEMESYLSDVRFQYMKTMVLLQNYVNYLTYRSNGSPKKIIKSVHEFIRVSGPDYSKDSLFFVAPCTNCTDKAHVAYLYFSFQDQYRIGFINHLYRPFIVKNGETFKKYSDNIIIATTYLFDHLLKFHPFAFSFSSLELIPEVLSTSKTPSLRNHIQVIMDYLSNNHLRETEIGIFDYKFYSRTVNELVYLSKVFEEESAAFNFTLDEAYLIKLHIRRELQSLRKNFGDRLETTFSATHLNGMLADLHFFDQEYDAAIVAYSNAISGIKTAIGAMSLIDFVVMVRYKLKLGLTFEKVKNYDEALSFYADAAENAKVFIMARLAEGGYLGPQPNTNTNVDRVPYNTSVLSDLLQIVNQAFIAKIVLQEKMGIEGITNLKFGIAMGGFLSLSKNVAAVCGRSYMINANLYLVVGNLLFFKNSNKGFGIQKLKDDGELENFIAAFDERELKKFFYLRNNLEYLNNDEKRSPLLALCLYVIGLTEVINSRTEAENSLDYLFFTKENEVTDVFKDYNEQEFRKKEKYEPQQNLAREIIGYLTEKKILDSPVFSKSHNKYIAMFLSHIGDCLLSMVEIKGLDKLLITEIFDLKKFGEAEKFPDYLAGNVLGEKWAPAISDVLLCYYWAAQFFQKRGRMVSYSFQLRKILYTLRLVLKDNSETPRQPGSKEDLNKILGKLEETVLNPILEIASKTSEHSDRYLVKKYEDIFQTAFDEGEAVPLYSAFIKNNIANHPDSREAISLFLHIKLKILPLYKNVYNKYKNFVNPYDSFATQYTRIFELAFWGKMNKIRFKTYEKKLGVNGISFDKTIEKLEEEHHKDANEIFSCAKEYLFSFFAIIHILDIYGLDYMISHTFKAYIHRHIGEFLTKYPSFTSSVIESIRSRFGYHIQGSLNDPYYHYSMAKTHYEKAIQVHTVGPEYLKYMDNIIYLEDDINDNAYHFGAAMDRFLLFNNILENMRVKCEKSLADIGNHLDDYLEKSVIYRRSTAVKKPVATPVVAPPGP